MKSLKNIKTRQKKIEHQKQKRKQKEKLNRKKKNTGETVTYQLIQTITHFFPDLFDRVRQIDDCRKKTSDYELAELIIAGIAMFLFKEGSRNAFNNDRKEENFSKNYEKLFKMRLPHMDTVDAVMRVLEENELEELKASLVKTLIEKKSLHKFRFLKRWFIVAVDGSGVFSFSEKHCDHCTHTTSKNGNTTYFHNVLEAKIICCNGFSISVATEWIENAEGDYEKQDCEQKAFKRLQKRLKMFYPRLPICITTDGLYPNEPFFNICKNNNWHFIVNFEKGNLPSVWKIVEQLKLTTDYNKHSQVVYQKNEKIQYYYCWINGIDYRGNPINFIECKEVIKNIKNNKIEVSRFVYLTDIEINRSNAAEVVHTGRLRWKIENEGFNTQKNLGYNLQHKYSRVSYLAAKNYYQCLQIGHLLNQLLEHGSKFKVLLKDKNTIKQLWKCLIGFMIFCDIDSKKVSILTQLRIQVRFE